MTDLIYFRRDTIGFLDVASSLVLIQVATREFFYHEQNEFDMNFSDVQRQENIKRALEIATAGAHNIMML